MDGVTPNDAGDVDAAGGNELQNFPDLTGARTSGTAVAIAGQLQSQPARSYRVEFFANSACDPTGFGECERYLGSHRVVTDAAGQAFFLAILPAPVAAGAWITSTATDEASGLTSECSECVMARSGHFVRPPMSHR